MAKQEATTKAYPLDSEVDCLCQLGHGTIRTQWRHLLEPFSNAEVLVDKGLAAEVARSLQRITHGAIAGSKAVEVTMLLALFTLFIDA